MIVAIDQPHFLPGLAYLDRMQKADVFVLLDDAPFERPSCQNRAQIKNGQAAHWLAVPIFHQSQKELILDKLIDNHHNGQPPWGRKAALALQHAYKGAPHYGAYAPVLEEILEAGWDRLIDLDRALLEFFMDVLGLRRPIMLSSQLGTAGRKGERILGLCHAVGADTFLAGQGARRSPAEAKAFDRAGVQVLWQYFRHPSYAQHPRPDAFIEGLSAVDLLFNCGPESGDVLMGKAYAYAAAARAEGAD